MNMHATALAHPNIAFIKFWGLADEPRRIPANGSLSMNIDGLTTRTRVEFDPTLAADELLINGQPVFGNGLERVQTFMDRIRRLAAKNCMPTSVATITFPLAPGWPPRLLVLPPWPWPGRLHSV